MTWYHIAIPTNRTRSIFMPRVKPITVFIAIASILVILGAAGVELTRGLSLTRGLHNLTVKDIYAMGSSHDKLYLSIDLDPSAAHLRSIRVALDDISLDINPALATDMVISSTDPYIWGDRWPWVEKVTITLKTKSQKEGFEQLLKAEKLNQLESDLDKGMVVGVTHFGLLTSGGRIVDY